MDPTKVKRLTLIAGLFFLLCLGIFAIVILTRKTTQPSDLQVGTGTSKKLNFQKTCGLKDHVIEMLQEEAQQLVDDAVGEKVINNSLKGLEVKNRTLDIGEKCAENVNELFRCILLLKKTLRHLRFTETNKITPDDLITSEITYKEQVVLIKRNINSIISQSDRNTTNKIQDVTKKIQEFEAKMDFFLDKLEMTVAKNQHDLLSVTAFLITTGKTEEAALKSRDIHNKTWIKTVVQKAYDTPVKLETKVINIMGFIGKLSEAKDLELITTAYETLFDFMLGKQSKTSLLLVLDYCVKKSISNTKDETHIKTLESVRTKMQQPINTILNIWAANINSTDYTEILEFAKKNEESFINYSEQLTKNVWSLFSSSMVEANYTGNNLIKFADQLLTSKAIVFTTLFGQMEEDKNMPLEPVIKLGYRDYHDYGGSLNIIRRLPRSIQLVIKGRPVTISSPRYDILLNFHDNDIFGDQRTTRQKLNLDPTPKWILSSSNKGETFFIQYNYDKNYFCLGGYGPDRKCVLRESTADPACAWKILQSNVPESYFIVNMQKQEFLNSRGFDYSSVYSGYNVYVVFGWHKRNEIGRTPYWTFDDN